MRPGHGKFTNTMASPRPSRPASSNPPVATFSPHRSIPNGSRQGNHGRPRLEELAGPAGSARTVGLRYVSDQMPGIRRERAGKSFRYRYPIGDIVHDEQVLARIRSLAI